MTSYTSSSDAAPRWGSVWVLALLVTSVTVGLWELQARSAGLGPDYIDNRALWADARHNLNSLGDTAIVLLGASRMQRAVDVETMSRSFDRPVVQLAVEGTSALALLENLAVDPRFRGTVIYSIAPAFSFNSALPRVDTGKQAEWVQFYMNQSYSRRIEQRLRLFFQGLFAFRSPDAELTRVIPALYATGSLPTKDFKTTLANREALFDYTKMAVEHDEVGIAQFYLENTVPYADKELQLIINYFADLVRALRQKGCDVYMLRLPSTKEVWALESAFFPRARFWDVMERRIDATFVHFEDFPGLTGYMSQDGSHIESTRVMEFTQELSRVLRANDLR